MKLRLLSIQSNRITKIEGLENLVNLEEFYISHNGLEKLEGLENNVSPYSVLCNSRPHLFKVKLTTLDIGNNRISLIENITHLKALQEFWVSDGVLEESRD